MSTVYIQDCYSNRYRHNSTSSLTSNYPYYIRVFDCYYCTQGSCHNRKWSLDQQLCCSRTNHYCMYTHRIDMKNITYMILVNICDRHTRITSYFGFRRLYLISSSIAIISQTAADNRRCILIVARIGSVFIVANI